MTNESISKKTFETLYKKTSIKTSKNELFIHCDLKRAVKRRNNLSYNNYLIREVFSALGNDGTRRHITKLSNRDPRAIRSLRAVYQHLTEIYGGCTSTKSIRGISCSHSFLGYKTTSTVDNYQNK